MTPGAGYGPSQVPELGNRNESHCVKHGNKADWKQGNA